jgi:hypothetical protein
MITTNSSLEIFFHPRNGNCRRIINPGKLGYQIASIWLSWIPWRGIFVITVVSCSENHSTDMEHVPDQVDLRLADSALATPQALHACGERAFRQLSGPPTSARPALKELGWADFPNRWADGMRMVVPIVLTCGHACAHYFNF